MKAKQTKTNKLTASQAKIAKRMLLLCAIHQPIDIAEHLTSLTMQLVATSMLRYDNIEKALEKISNAVNEAAKGISG